MKEALSTPEKNEWMKTVKSEIDPLHTNKVWNLTKLSSGQKAISSKWAFKWKCNADGHMEQHKAIIFEAQKIIRC